MEQCVGTMKQHEDKMEQRGGTVEHSVSTMVLCVGTMEQWDETMEQCDDTI